MPKDMQMEEDLEHMHPVDRIVARSAPIRTLEDLACFIEKLQENPNTVPGFHMNFTDYRDAEDEGCGTAMCIGGWARALTGYHHNSIVRAVSALGCRYAEASALCYPETFQAVDPYKATPAQGARAIRILDETGTCDWPRAMREA